MSTLHSSNRYYDPREFKEPPHGVVIPVWVAIGLMAIAAFAGFHGGGWIERQTTPKPQVRVIRGPAPLTQWTCEPRERSEYLEACRRRAAAALTKPR